MKDLHVARQEWDLHKHYLYSCEQIHIFLQNIFFLFYVLSLFDLIRFINTAITFKIIAPSSFMPRHCAEREDESYNFVGIQ